MASVCVGWGCEVGDGVWWSWGWRVVCVVCGEREDGGWRVGDGGLRWGVGDGEC